MQIPEGFHQATPTYWACDRCGARGLPCSPDYLNGWVVSHMREHHDCADCGKSLVSYPSGKRRRHSRCSNRIGG